MSPELRTVVERYNALPEPIQQDIFYGHVKEVGEIIAASHGFDRETQIALENQFTLTLLGFQSIDDMKQNFIQEFGYDEEVTDSIYLAFETLILIPLAERLDNIPTKEVAATEPPATTPVAEPTPLKAPDQGVATPSLRTMAGDMNYPAKHDTPTIPNNLVGGLDYEPVYTSSQDNIRRPLSDTPSYTNTAPPEPTITKSPSLDEPPRWGA